MKRIYTLLLAMLLSYAGLVAQITVTNATFPVPGDSLMTTAAISVPTFDPTLIGGDLDWDFSSVATGVTTSTLFADAATGSAIDSFPDADLLQVSAGLGQEIYYKSSNNRIVEIGRSGLDPVFAAVDFNASVDGNAVYRRAPLSFGDTYDDTYGFAIEIPVSALPDSIASIFAGLVTDIRVRVDFEIYDEVDAWGTVQLPTEQYDVVRLNRETTTLTKVEVRFLGSWVNLLDLPIMLPEFAADLVRPATVNNYIFMSNDAKEEIANITVDSTGLIVAATFKAAGTSTSTSPLTTVSPHVLVYPNPSFGDATFVFDGMPKDTYRVDVYDVLGKKAWTGTTTEAVNYLRADLSELRRGTYVYRVYDGKGKKLVTKRLMIVRP